MAKCGKCGRELPGNMSFCGFCGASVQQGNSYSGQSYSQQNNQQHYGNSYGQNSNSYGGISRPAGKQKKKSGVIVRILAGLVAFIVGSLVCTFLINTLVGPPNPSTDNDVNAVVTQQQERTVNPEYERIFSERYIVESIDFFYNLDYKVYAKVLEGEIVEKMAVAYDGDIVKEMHNVIYIPVSGYTEEQKVVFEQEIRKEYAVLDNEEFCTITYTMGNNYLIVNIECVDLDVKSNIDVLVDFGMISGNYVYGISMKETDTGLISNGYTVKYFD